MNLGYTGGIRGPKNFKQIVWFPCHGSLLYSESLKQQPGNFRNSFTLKVSGVVLLGFCPCLAPEHVRTLLLVSY